VPTKLIIADSRVLNLNQYLGDSLEHTLILQTILPSDHYNNFDELDQLMSVYLNKNNIHLLQVTLISSTHFDVSKTHCVSVLRALSYYLEKKYQLTPKKVTAYIALENKLSQLELSTGE
jgi:hypothetical protein